ncbi:hypothetical protein GGQ18_002956 [Salinibacter ruber]|nr:hypothetical protein [Salinibacter ruber]
MDWYRSLWQPGGKEGFMEATTLYTGTPMLPNAAVWIDPVEGEFRFIYIMRDPIRWAESQVRYRAARGHVFPMTRWEISGSWKSRDTRNNWTSTRVSSAETAYISLHWSPL